VVTNFSKEPRKEINDDETWMWKRNINIGTWNVRSLFWSGALKVLHNELSKLDFEVVAHDWEVVYRNLVTLHYLIVDRKAKNVNSSADFCKRRIFKICYRLQNYK